MKKKISLATITFVIASALIAILALFGILKINGIIADLLFTFLTLSVAGILTIGSCDMLEKKNIMALVSISLIAISTLLVILCYWTTLDNKQTYLNITLIISTLSVCFNLISSSILKMRGKHKIVQTLGYICYSAVSLYLISSFIKVISLKDTNLKIFILFIILSLLSMAILAILSKRQNVEITETKEYVKITKAEYENLLEKKKQLEELLKGKKSND